MQKHLLRYVVGTRCHTEKFPLLPKKTFISFHLHKSHRPKGYNEVGPQNHGSVGEMRTRLQIARPPKIFLFGGYYGGDNAQSISFQVSLLLRKDYFVVIGPCFDDFFLRKVSPKTQQEVSIYHRFVTFRIFCRPDGSKGSLQTKRLHIALFFSQINIVLR